VLGDGFDLTVLGNHGAVYHDAGSARLGDAPVEITAEAQPPLTPELIRQALQDGEPLTPTPALPRPGEGSKPGGQP
jgi:hypothetical protein